MRIDLTKYMTEKIEIIKDFDSAQFINFMSLHAVKNPTVDLADLNIDLVRIKNLNTANIASVLPYLLPLKNVCIVENDIGEIKVDLKCFIRVSNTGVPQPKSSIMITNNENKVVSVSSIHTLYIYSTISDYGMLKSIEARSKFADEESCHIQLSKSEVDRLLYLCEHYSGVESSLTEYINKLVNE